MKKMIIIVKIYNKVNSYKANYLALEFFYITQVFINHTIL